MVVPLFATAFLSDGIVTLIVPLFCKVALVDPIKLDIVVSVFFTLKVAPDFIPALTILAFIV